MCVLWVRVLCVALCTDVRGWGGERNNLGTPIFILDSHKIRDWMTKNYVKK